MEDYWVWCGSPAKGEDGRFHLFAATGDGAGGFGNMTRTWNMVVPLKS